LSIDIIEYLRKVIGPRPPEIKIPDDYPQRQPLYKILFIPLDKARNPEEHKECFKELYVEKAEGTAYISLSDKNAGEIELKQGLILYSKVDVDKWYIRNDVQADKEIKLVLSKNIDFFLRVKQAVRITQLIDILEHAKVMYLEADKIKSGTLQANLIISSLLKTAESGGRIEIDGSLAIPEIKAFNQDGGQTLSIKADGSGWIGELVNGEHPISWDTHGKVEIQVAYIKGLIAYLIVAGFLTVDTITANLITTGILKSMDGKTYFDLDASEIVTVHPNNADKRVKYSGGGIYVSEDGGASWLGAIVYNEVTGKVGFDMSSGVMGQLAGSLLELDHLYAVDTSQVTNQYTNRTEYKELADGVWKEHGSSPNITVATGQVRVKVTFNLRAYMDGGDYVRIKIQLCDTSGNMKKEVIKQTMSGSYVTWNVTWELSPYFSEGQQFKIRRWLWRKDTSYAPYSNLLKVDKIGALYPLTYR